MGFEVRPTGLGSTRWYARIVLAIALCAGFVGLGVAARIATTAPDSQNAPSPTAVAAPRASGRPRATPLPSPMPGSYPPSRSAQAGAQVRPLPRDLDCHGLAPAVCTRVATAALSVLTPELPAISSAAVYNSLICDSNFDCPRDRLTPDALPLGSVTFSFADGGPSAWINVVQHGPTPSVGQAPAEAWLIRWR
jgi:hypothetical protein